MYEELHTQSSPGVETPTRVGPVLTTSGRLILAGSALLALGSVLPWATVSAPFVGSYAVNGLRAGGILTLPIAGTIAYLGRNAHREQLTTVPKRVAIVGLAFAAVIVVLNLTQIISVAGKDTTGLVQVSPGLGLFVAAAGIVVGAIGVFRNKTARQSDSVSQLS